MAKALLSLFFFLANVSARAESAPLQSFCFPRAGCQSSPLPLEGDTMAACQRYLDHLAFKSKLPLLRGSWSIRNACYEVYGEAGNVQALPRDSKHIRSPKKRSAPRGRQQRGSGCAPGYYQDPTNPQQCRPDIADGRYRNGNGQVCRNEPDTQGGYVWVCR